jgi:lipopolysaccharide export LptBFGC system permease protein LptF
MKSLKILSIIFAGTLCFYAPQALAFKQVVYQDLAVLRPIPDDSLPNVSGNIDWPNTSQNQNEVDADNTPTDSSLSATTSESDASISNPTASVVNNTSDNKTSSTSSPENPSTGNTSSPKTSGSDTQKQMGQNFDPSNPFSYFDSQQNSAQENVQKQNAQTKNAETVGITDTSGSNQDSPAAQKAASWSFYVQIIVLGLVALLVIIFIIWKLVKKTDK